MSIRFEAAFIRCTIFEGGLFTVSEAQDSPIVRQADSLRAAMLGSRNAPSFSGTVEQWHRQISQRSIENFRKNMSPKGLNTIRVRAGCVFSGMTGIQYITHKLQPLLSTALGVRKEMHQLRASVETEWFTDEVMFGYF